MNIVLTSIVGFILDLLLPDSHRIPHPVIFIGKWIHFLDRKFNKKNYSDTKKLYLGLLTVILVVSSIGAMVIILEYLLYRIHFAAGFVFDCIFSFSAFACCSLKKESMKVYYELEKNDLEKARCQLSMIVGRDTENLNTEEITKAAVETIAENTSDGVIAPMFYYMLGGLPLAYIYKAINTMDSMLGYKNEKYLYFGRAAAKLDDFMNFIPSRLCGYCMIISSYICRLNYKNALRIFKRDRFNHLSPNSAQSESVCAGALGIELGGDNFYFGKIVRKKHIGDNIRPIEISDIKKAIRLLYVTAIVHFMLICIIRLVVISCV